MELGQKSHGQILLPSVFLFSAKRLTHIFLLFYLCDDADHSPNLKKLKLQAVLCVTVGLAGTKVSLMAPAIYPSTALVPVAKVPSSPPNVTMFLKLCCYCVLSGQYT